MTTSELVRYQQEWIRHAVRDSMDNDGRWKVMTVLKMTRRDQQWHNNSILFLVHCPCLACSCSAMSRIVSIDVLFCFVLFCFVWFIQQIWTAAAVAAVAVAEAEGAGCWSGSLACLCTRHPRCGARHTGESDWARPR